jgi:hypothetical protein
LLGIGWTDRRSGLRQHCAECAHRLRVTPTLAAGPESCARRSAVGPFPCPVPERPGDENAVPPMRTGAPWSDPWQVPASALHFAIGASLIQKSLPPCQHTPSYDQRACADRSRPKIKHQWREPIAWRLHRLVAGAALWQYLESETPGQCHM